MCDDMLQEVIESDRDHRATMTMIALRAEVAQEPDNSQHLPQVDRYAQALETIAAIARGDVL